MTSRSSQSLPDTEAVRDTRQASAMAMARVIDHITSCPGCHGRVRCAVAGPLVDELEAASVAYGATVRQAIADREAATAAAANPVGLFDA